MKEVREREIFVLVFEIILFSCFHKNQRENGKKNANANKKQQQQL